MAETQVVYRAIADFQSLRKEISRTRREMAQLRAEELAGNRASIKAANEQATARGNVTEALKREAAALRDAQAAASAHASAASSSASATERSAKASSDLSSRARSATSSVENAAKAHRDLDSASRKSGLAQRIAAREIDTVGHTADAAAPKLRFLQRVMVELGSAKTKLQSQGSGGIFDNLVKGADSAGNSLKGFLGTVPGILKLIFALNAIGPGIASLGALASAALGVVGAIAQAGAAIGHLPAVAAVAATGIFALVVALKGVGKVFQAYSAGQAAAAKTTTKSASQIQDAADRIADARRALARAERDGARAAVDSADRIRQAQVALQLARESQARAAEDANQRVSAADRALAKDQRAVRRAQDDVNKARETALKDLIALRMEVSRGTISEERAIANLKQAQEAYANVMADPGSTQGDKLDALANLHEAEQALQDVRNENVANQNKLADAEAKGIDGSDAVTTAKERQADAEAAVVDSIEAAKQAREDATRSERDEARNVADAQKALADARQSAADSAVDSADRIADAQRALNRAIRDSTAPSAAAAGAMDAYNAALAALSPSAQKFVKGIIAMRDEWKKLKSAVQEAFFAPLVGQLDGIKDSLPFLKDNLVTVAAALGEVIAKFIAWVTDPSMRPFFKMLADSTAKIVRILGPAFLDVLDGFVSIIEVSLPFLEDFAKYLGDSAKSFKEWAQQAQATGSLADTFKKAGERLKQIGDIVGSVARGFGSLIKAADPFISWVMDGLAKSADTFERWSKAQESPDSPLKKYLEDIKPLLTAMGDLMKDILKVFAKQLVDPKNIKNATDFFTLLDQKLVPALDRFLTSLSDNTDLSGFVDAAVALVDAFTKMSDQDVGGVFTKMLEILTKVITAFTWILDHSDGLSFFFKGLAYTLAAIAALKFLGVLKLAKYLRSIAKGEGALGKLSDRVRKINRVAPHDPSDIVPDPINPGGRTRRDNPYVNGRGPAGGAGGSGNAPIHGGRITGTTITGTTIKGTTITGTTIRGGDITGTTIKGTTIRGTNITGTTIKGTTITGGTIRGGDISGGTITGSTIRGGAITGGAIKGDAITGGRILGDQIKGTTITGTTIRGTTITGTTIRGTTITGGTIYGGDIIARGNGGTNGSGGTGGSGSPSGGKGGGSGGGLGGGCCDCGSSSRSGKTYDPEVLCVDCGGTTPNKTSVAGSSHTAPIIIDNTTSAKGAKALGGNIATTGSKAGKAATVAKAGKVVSKGASKLPVVGTAVDAATMAPGAWKKTYDISNQLQGKIADMARATPGLFSSMFTKIGSLFSGFSRMMGDFGGKIVDVITWPFRKIYDLLVGHSIVPDTINEIVNWFMGLPGKVLSALGNIITTLASKGRDLVMGLWNGATSKLAEFGTWVGGIAVKVASWIGDTAKTLWTKGSDFFVGLWNGAKAKAAEIGTWLAGRAAWAASQIGSLASTLWTKGSEFFNGLWNGIKSKAVEVGTWLAGRPAAFKTSLGDLKTTLLSAGTALIQGLWDGIKATWTKLTDWLKPKFDDFKGLFKTPIEFVINKVFYGGILRGYNLIPGLNDVTIPPDIHLARGGRVPGHGSGDTVPAMLTPGEVVIKKSSVKKIGMSRLLNMNETGEVQHFAGGGPVQTLSIPDPLKKIAGAAANVAGSVIDKTKNLAGDALAMVKKIAQVGAGAALSAFLLPIRGAVKLAPDKAGIPDQPSNYAMDRAVAWVKGQDAALKKASDKILQDQTTAPSGGTPASPGSKTGSTIATGGTTGSVTDRGKQAIDWMRRQSNNPTQSWLNLCLSDTRQSLGVGARWPDAATAYANTSYRMGTGTAPAGVPVWWGGGQGHVGLSDGGGYMWGNDMVRRGQIDRHPISRVASQWGKPYKGWTKDINGVKVYARGGEVRDPRSGLKRDELFPAPYGYANGGHVASLMKAGGLAMPAPKALPGPRGSLASMPPSTMNHSVNRGTHVENMIVNNPKAEPASDSLPRSIRKLSYLGGS